MVESGSPEEESRVRIENRAGRKRIVGGEVGQRVRVRIAGGDREGDGIALLPDQLGEGGEDRRLVDGVDREGDGLPIRCLAVSDIEAHQVAAFVDEAGRPGEEAREGIEGSARRKVAGEELERISIRIDRGKLNRDGLGGIDRAVPDRGQDRGLVRLAHLDLDGHGIAQDRPGSPVPGILHREGDRVGSQIGEFRSPTEGGHPVGRRRSQGGSGG